MLHNFVEHLGVKLKMLYKLTINYTSKLEFGSCKKKGIFQSLGLKKKAQKANFKILYSKSFVLPLFMAIPFQNFVHPASTDRQEGTVTQGGRDGHEKSTVSGQKRKIYFNPNRFVFTTNYICVDHYR